MNLLEGLSLTNSIFWTLVTGKVGIIEEIGVIQTIARPKVGARSHTTPSPFSLHMILEEKHESIPIIMAPKFKIDVSPLLRLYMHL